MRSPSPHALLASVLPCAFPSGIGLAFPCSAAGPYCYPDWRFPVGNWSKTIARDASRALPPHPPSSSFLLSSPVLLHHPPIIRKSLSSASRPRSRPPESALSVPMGAGVCWGRTSLVGGSLVGGTSLVGGDLPGGGGTSLVGGASLVRVTSLVWGVDLPGERGGPPWWRGDFPGGGGTPWFRGDLPGGGGSPWCGGTSLVGGASLVGDLPSRRPAGN